MSRKSFFTNIFACFLAGILVIGPGGDLFGQLPPASFHHLKRDKDVYASSFHSLHEDSRGFIWFGSLGGGGLYRFDGYDVISFITEPDRIDSTISGIRITSILEINDSTMLIGSTFGFTRLNTISGRIRNYNNKLEQLSDERIGWNNDMYHDTVRHKVWIATLAGLGELDIRSGEFQMIQARIVRPSDSLAATDVTHIVQSPVDNDILYLVCEAKLWSYSKMSNTISYVQCPLMDIDDLHIRSVSEDGKGIWLNTLDHQLIRFAPPSSWEMQAAVPKIAGAKEPPYILNMQRQSDDLVWISTTDNVGLFNPISGDYEAWTAHADQPDGLLLHGNYYHMMTDRHGRLWIGSRVGVQYAKQAYSTPSGKQVSPPVSIIRLDAFPIVGHLEMPLLVEKNVSLHIDQRELTIHFVQPNPLNPANVSYEYKLDGYDRDWISTNQRQVRYSKLPGGDYTFQIKAHEGANGEWSPVTHLQIHIPKRITELFWFWGLVGLGFLAAAILIYRYLIYRARQEERLKADFEHQLSEIQMQALRAQMNPHFLFNSLNSIKYFAISKSKDETAAYLSKFALLVRAILNNSKERTISLKDELDALRLYIEIEHIRLEGKFDYTIDIDAGIHIRQVQIPPMILQPYVENAIWHGLMHLEGHGKLIVQVRDMGHHIQCVIEDNGIGRLQSATLRQKQLDHKKSVGMQITSDRIALINRIYHIDTQVHVVDLTHPDGTAAGTRVVINIPLIRDEEE